MKTMKAFGLFLLFLFIVTVAFIHLGCASKENIDPNPGKLLIGSRKVMASNVKNRKLKENINSDEAEYPGKMNLEDYRPIDPVPSSKASIKHGPISHGTPLLPFVPKTPPPPSQPKHGSFP